MSEPWWAEQDLELGQGLRVTAGPLQVVAFRREDEWQLTWGPAPTGGGDGSVSTVERLVEPYEESAELERYALRAETTRVRILPVMPDRPIVVKPRVALFVPPGESIQIYVSSPLWAQVTVGEPWRILREIPVKRLSDTWFGGSTLDGEVAYAIRTQARIQLSEISARPHRAVTPVVIRNHSDDTLPVERFNLPVTYLSVYAGENGRLWTENIVMTRGEGGEMAGLEVEPGAPREAGEAEQLTEPREASETNILVRAFSNLLDPFLGGDDD